MIAELLTTIIMALGVATGNVSSNSYKGGNAFNNVEKQKKPTQKANEVINDNYSYITVSNINGYIANQNNNYQIISKAYFYDQRNPVNRPTIDTGYYNIYNTTYRYTYKESETIINCRVLTLYKFIPYYNFGYENTQITQRIEINYESGTYNRIVIKFRNWQATNEIEDYIDLTLTNNTYNELNNYITNGTKTNFEQTIIYDSQTGSYDDNLTNTYTITGLQDNESYYVALWTDMEVYKNTSQTVAIRITPLNININGLAAVPTINYEIIDIPNLMYTILTMPFSFISTAFNLTVFPNTPYALNFGNLFLTILAVFILMWLLNKVFK